MKPWQSRTFISLILFVLAGAGWGYYFVRTHSFSARAKPTAFEAFLARKARGLAIPPGITDLKNPLEVTPLAIAQARDHFADHCAVCHGNDGSGKSMINEGLYPPAPDMRENDTQSLSDGELFYIIENGIRFTGMPGWGKADDENWKLVAFIRHLPKLSARELQLMNDINQLSGGKEHHE